MGARLWPQGGEVVEVVVEVTVHNSLALVIVGWARGGEGGWGGWPLRYWPLGPEPLRWKKLWGERLPYRPCRS